MSEIVNLSRRRFLKSSALAGGGLVLGFHIPGLTRSARADQGTTPGFKPNAFLRVGKDDSITVVVNHSEMGQGVYTGLPMILAEELDADWTKVRYEPAPVDSVYNHSVFGMQMTGGSTSTWSEWDRLRKAGAAARYLLVYAAAATWGVPASSCRTESGAVLHDESGRKLNYGKLVDIASTLTPPGDPPLKNPNAFRVIGKPTKRLDTPIKTNGAAVFGLDVALPGMLVAVVARPPVFGGKVKSFNAARAKAVPGVRDVVQIDRGLAVVADGFWPAKLGREALAVEWDNGPLADLDTDKQKAAYAQLAGSEGAVAVNDGDVDSALGSADRMLEAEYDLPYLAHATMEPLNCVADVRADSCTVWTGTQFQTADHAAAAKDAGVPLRNVSLHTTLLGGGFGRRAVPDSDFVREAVQISRAVAKPVKVVWTREDDMQGGRYRPRALHTVRAGLDKRGLPVAWQQRIVCQSFMAGTPFEPFVIRNGVDETAVEGARELPYAIPNRRLEWHEAKDGVPTLWWRSVGHSHTAFVVESFIDELAHAAGQDPLDYRRSLMGDGHARHRRVLDLVAEKAGWGGRPPEGRGRGIAEIGRAHV